MGGRWHVVELPSLDALSLDLTLSCGQAFRWVKTGEGLCSGTTRKITCGPVPLALDRRVRDGGWTEWTGTIGERLFTLVQFHTTLYYYRHTSSSSQAQDHKAVVDYFRISEDLTALYQEWGEKDTNFQQRSSHCKGVRLLRQDPFEALVAFICSSNNNVPRISLMLNKLCQQFGRCVGHYKEKDYFSFPPAESLASEGCEEILRKLGFGYRAKYVYQTARVIMEQHGGVKWLASLRDRSYKEAWETLQHLPGVGGKVADCVCLMALDHMGAVPVDTHVWHVAVRDYGIGETKGSGTLTARRYKEVGDLFRSTFGEKAGWAQTVLFTAELQRSNQASASLPPPPPPSAPTSKKRKQAEKTHQLSAKTRKQLSPLPETS